MMSKSCLLSLGVGLIMLVACVGQPEQTPTDLQPAQEITSSIPAPTVEPSVMPTTQEASQPSPPPPTDQPLEDIPPEWIVYMGGDGLWRIHPDGSDQSLLYEYEFAPDADFFEHRLSPDGRYLAFITAPQGYIYDNPVLTILSMPSGELYLMLPLTSRDTNPDPGAGEGDPKLEALRTIVDVESFAWSPDSAYLAFTSLINGPTSDLYVFSPDSKNLTRLTDGPTQAIRPTWSPDGQYIIHAGVNAVEDWRIGITISDEAGVLGVWAAAVDGSEVRRLYEPGSRDEIIDGWVDSSHFLTHSWNIDCGHEYLRVVDIATGSQQVLWEGAFAQVAFAPSNGMVLLAVNSETAACNTPPDAGLFLREEDFVRILDEEIRSITWSPDAQLFFANTEYGPIAVSSGFDYVDLDVSFDLDTYAFPPVVEPTTRQLAWTSSNGLWVSQISSGLDNPPLQVFDRPTAQVIWGQELGWLYFISESDLYSVSPLQPAPVKIAEFPGIMAMTVIGENQ